MTVAKVKITDEGHIPVGLEVLARVYLQIGDEVEAGQGTRGRAGEGNGASGGIRER